jgi:hypothetical protein
MVDSNLTSLNSSAMPPIQESQLGKRTSPVRKLSSKSSSIESFKIKEKV